jgi:hypothetical protein
MGEGYLVQEAMGVYYDIIGDMDKYTPQVWKEDEDEWKTGLDYYFLTSHSLFFFLFLLKFVASFFMFRMTLEYCVLYLRSFLSAY